MVIEIAQRYSNGEISRDQAIEELANWPYTSGGRPDPYDDAWEPGPDSWADLTFATHQGLITDDMYEEIFNRNLELHHGG